MIDLSSALLCGLGGGLGAGLANLIIHKAKISHPNVKAAIMGSLPVLFIMGMQAPPVQKFADTHIFKKSKFELFVKEMEREIVFDPAVMDRLKRLPAADAKKHFTALVHDGLYFLDVQDLDKWNSARLDMSRNSKSLCVAFIRGGANEVDFVAAFEKLTDQTRDDWKRISVAALKLSLARANPLEDLSVRADFQKYLPEVIAVNGPEEAKKMADVLQNHMVKSDDETCWVAQKIHQNAAKLPTEKRIVFLRGLASL